MQPLDGVDVLDFTQSIAGPTCTQTLSVFGANVVKVEPPGGDAFRPLVEGAMFASCNRGKRSISIDLKDERGVSIARDLAATADVVVESFRPGVMDGFGLGYDDVAADNPEVVYCSITGFGQDGPYEQYPAYDPVAQAMSGLMSVTGQPDGEPVRLGTSAIDINTGMTAAMLVLGGLMQRNAGDGGEYFDVSLFDVATTWMNYWTAYYTSTGSLPQRAGSGLYGFAPYGVFEAADGDPFYLATISEVLWERLCDVLDREDLLADERFETSKSRWDNREALAAELEPEFRAHDRRDLVETLTDAGVPSGPLQYVDELVEDDKHAEHRDLFVPSVNQGLDTDCRTVRRPFRDSDGPIDDARAPPTQGEHTRAVLSEFGYDADTVADLIDDGVLLEP
jgi:crotonobetainyl-CoA:carnitine CoA-transferase CaiB-like acyl-CoA transferase